MQFRRWLLCHRRLRTCVASGVFLRFSSHSSARILQLVSWSCIWRLWLVPLSTHLCLLKAEHAWARCSSETGYLLLSVKCDLEAIASITQIFGCVLTCHSSTNDSVHFRCTATERNIANEAIKVKGSCGSRCCRHGGALALWPRRPVAFGHCGVCRRPVGCMEN